VAATVAGVKLTGPRLRSKRWTHVALSYEGRTAYLLVNGRVVASRAAAPPATTTRTLTIGRRFDGRLDDVAVYTQALTVAQLRADRQVLL
jgi:hypothetical protein